MNRPFDGMDLIRMQVMWNRLLAVVEEQAQVLLTHRLQPDRPRVRGPLGRGV